MNGHHYAFVCRRKPPFPPKCPSPPPYIHHRPCTQARFHVVLCSGEDVRAAHLDTDESDTIRLIPKDRVCVRVRLAGEPVKTLQHCIERGCLCGEKKRSGGATRSKRKPRKHTPKSKRKRRKTQHSVKKVNFLAFCPDSFIRYLNINIIMCDFSGSICPPWHRRSDYSQRTHRCPPDLPLSLARRFSHRGSTVSSACAPS